jgi:hypothetical protein
MVLFKVDEKFESEKEILFDSASLPYYILNTNLDIEKIREFEDVSNECFPNLISSVAKFYNMKSIDELTLNEVSKKGKVLRCSTRSNLLEYVKWFIYSEQTIIEKLNSFEWIVELPLIFNKYVYAKILPQLAGKSFSIYKSEYFDPYIECVYMYRIADSKEINKISNYSSFKRMFDQEFKNALCSYLISMSNVSAYIKSGNFYGQEMQKYKKIKQDYFNKLDANKYK